jgi:hypothetical protein
MMKAFVLVLVLSACASAPIAELPSAAPVIAAERAFAARAGEIGWTPAFREFTAPEGVILRPDPVSAPEALAQLEDDGDRSLQWWPAWAGVSRSGDFGFTTGPFVFGDSDQIRGHYFTVWRRQPDGSWKWIFDGGVGAVDADPIARDAEVPQLPLASGGAGAARAAVAQVATIQLSHNSSDLLASYLAPDARVNRAGLPPVSGADARAAFLRPSTLYEDSPEGMLEASGAGDMVFALGRAIWVETDGAHEGYYARIWQWRGGGWMIVFDELIPSPHPRADQG